MLTQFCQEISTGRGVAAYLAALPSGIAAGAALFWAVAALRRGNLVWRFTARLVVCVGGMLAFEILMRLIGGPCWLAGPTRFGGYDSRPQTGRDLVESAVVIGLLFALMAPFAGRATGQDVDF